MSIESVISHPDNSDAITSLNHNQDVFFPKKNQQQLALQDLWEGMQKWRIWLMLAYQDVKLRYRRSVLGPFWITISMAITVYSMGYLYGHLFHSNLQTYFPFLVAGMLAWALISSQLTELTEAFIASDGLIKQIKLPYSLYIHRVATRNIIIFFHNIVVIIPILAIFHEVAKVNLNTLMLIPGLMLVYVNTIIYGLVLAMICARYRDLGQIIKSLIQVAFFLTPIMWNPSVLPASDRYIVMLNPFYACVELIRAPLLGTIPTSSTFIMVGIITTIGMALCYMMFTRYRARIVYWL
jgi:lipopolysaccharide transport system permease protein